MATSKRDRNHIQDMTREGPNIAPPAHGRMPPRLDKPLPNLPGHRSLGERSEPSPYPRLSEIYGDIAIYKEPTASSAGRTVDLDSTYVVQRAGSPTESTMAHPGSVILPRHRDIRQSRLAAINSSQNKKHARHKQSRNKHEEADTPAPLRLNRVLQNAVHVAKESSGPLKESSRPYESFNILEPGGARDMTYDYPPLPARHSGPPPDGGFLAWAHAWGGFFVVFNCWGLNSSFGIFQDFYGRELLAGTSASSISWIGSTQLFLIFALGLPVGRAVDRGHFRIFFNGGSAILVLATFCASFCTKYWQLLLVQGILTGAAMGMVFCSGLAVLLSYFDRNVGLACGVAAAGSSAGGIVYTLLARKLLSSSGLAWTFRGMGLLALATMIIPNVIYRPCHTTKFERHSADWRVLLNRAYILMTIGMFFAFWGLYFGLYYIIPYATQSLDMSRESATNILIAMLAVNLPGRFLPAIISDQCLGPINTLIPFASLSSLLMFLWPGAQRPGTLTVLACAYGLAAAGIQALYAPAVRVFAEQQVMTAMQSGNADILSAAETAGRDTQVQGTVQQPSGDERLGLSSGLVLTVIGVACLTGVPIGGALVDAGSRRGKEDMFLYAQMFAGASLGVAAVCFIASRVVKVGWRAERV